MYSEFRFGEGGSRVAADCRLDNRDVLRDRLGLVRPDPSDAELILAAYSRWGERCPEELLGDFAFALWDGARQTVFAARDPFGARRLVYTRSPHAFACASDSRELAGLTRPPRTINQTRIAHYLVPALEGIDPSATPFEGVFRLPASHSLTATPERTDLRRHWRPDGARTVRLGSDAEYAEAFLELFDRAVTCRLQGTARPASMLSGGVDSSSIVGVARRRLAGSGGPPLVTFSAVSERAEMCAETRAIRATAALPGLDCVFVRRDRLQPWVDELAARLDDLEELFDTQMILPLLIYIAARRRGVEVLLDGVDGDSVVSLEPGCLAWLLREGRGIAAWREARGLARFYDGYYPPWASSGRLLYGAARTAWTPRALKRSWRRIRARRRADALLEGSIIDRDFARAVGLKEDVERLHGHAGTEAGHACQIDHPYIAAALERYGRVAAACSIEARHPFFDRHLVEFCVGLPLEQKLRGGWSKWILRRACEGLLPDEVRWRRGRWERLGPAFTTAFLETRIPALEEVVADGLQQIRDYVDVEAVRRSWRRFRLGRDAEDGEKVWQAVRLVSWLRRGAELDIGSAVCNKRRAEERIRATCG